MIDPKVGNTVKLVSGGPSMTIIEIGNLLYSGKVLCAWYDATAAKQSEWYPVDALMPAPKVGGPA